MNSNLLQNRHSTASKEEFQKAWDNAGFVLEALWKTLVDWQEENNKVRKDDFDCPNHYARLAYQAGYIKALSDVIGLLPDSAKP